MTMTAQHAAPKTLPAGWRLGAALPSITVACDNTGCAAAGKRRRVMLATPVPGVIAAPGTLLCARCGCQVKTLSGWPPVEEEDDDMAKITRHGGATNAAADREAAEAAQAAEPEETGAPQTTLAAEETAEPAAEEAPQRPHNVDSKPTWLAYAKAIGVEGADQMTKAQLIEAADFWAAEQAANDDDLRGGG